MPLAEKVKSSLDERHVDIKEHTYVFICVFHLEVSSLFSITVIHFYSYFCVILTVVLSFSTWSNILVSNLKNKKFSQSLFVEVISHKYAVNIESMNRGI